jgi:hypothetical protein
MNHASPEANRYVVFGMAIILLGGIWIGLCVIKLYQTKETIADNSFQQHLNELEIQNLYKK